MECTSGAGVRGHVTFTLLDHVTGKEERWEADNVITTNGKNLICGILGAVAGTSGLSHCALGTDNTAAAASQTQLFAEGAASRRVISSTGVDTATSVLIVDTFFTSGEVVGTWAEVGLFGGGATNAKDSGVMVARVVSSITKTISQSLTVSWRITVS